MINVLGIGNVLMGDDGFGPAVVRAFDAAYQAGLDVDVVDIGTPGLDLMPWFADVDRLVIVDTVKSSLPPGTMCLYDKGDVLRHVPSVRVGPHDPGVKEALLTLEFAGRAPREVTLIGVVPSRTDLALDLSPAVEAAVAPAVQAIVETLERFGVCVTPRSEVASKPMWCPPSRLRGASARLAVARSAEAAGGPEVRLKPDATGFEA